MVVDFIDLYFFKFKIMEEYLLNDFLKKMGMVFVFEGGDFLWIIDCGGVLILVVIYKVFVEVNE